MNPMIEKLSGLWPEIIMISGAILCLFTGLTNARRMTGAVAALTLILAFMLADHSGTPMAYFAQKIVPLMGLLLLMMVHEVPQTLKTAQAADAGIAPDYKRSIRGEFFAFFLMSLTGVMLCAHANDLVWMFLALELTSLPTYIMVAVMRDKLPAQEAGIKYFFLGALAAAIFLYGFALMYGGTGTTTLIATDSPSIYTAVDAWLDKGEPISPLLLAGVALSIIGISFKIAAVPMHFYTADVYQGATMPVTAFLAFVPKAAGFFCLITIVKAISGSENILPDSIAYLIALIAVVTMTIGNVMALIQRRLKRVMAYSSIAHSGYMLVGLLAVPVVSINMLDRGDTAIFFYLVTYGLANLAVFGILSSLRSHDDFSEDAETFEDLKGLRHKSPMLTAILLIGSLSLIGLPPMVGFLGKIQLFSGAMRQGYGALVTVAVINSAISAAYYLKIPAHAFFEAQGLNTHERKMTISRPTTATISAALCILLGFSGTTLINYTNPQKEEVKTDVTQKEEAGLAKAQ